MFFFKKIFANRTLTENYVAKGDFVLVNTEYIVHCSDPKKKKT